MKNIIIIGGSKGIGNAIMTTLLENNRVINISRTAPETKHESLTHYGCNVIEDELPDISEAH